MEKFRAALYVIELVNFNPLVEGRKKKKPMKNEVIHIKVKAKKKKKSYKQKES